MNIEILTKAAWLALALGHLAPCAPIIAPQLIEKLYGVAPSGDLGVLLRHRAIMFLIVVVLCVWAAFAPDVRTVALVVTALSVIGFLVTYALAGSPKGALRTVALVDAALLAPLSFAAWTHFLKH